MTLSSVLMVPLWAAAQMCLTAGTFRQVSVHHVKAPTVLFYNGILISRRVSFVPKNAAFCSRTKVSRSIPQDNVQYCVLVLALVRSLPSC